ncbi:MAG: DcaP family trimeric outer membrane transporter [candidate division KSB1 bacterium]|nr:DcaP family trimeric outer membrane transporter [candidate division KSB1 bacterium]
MKRLVFILFICISSLYAGDSDFGIHFSGFVKTDLMLDSRQTVAAREGHYLLYPAGENKDQNGDDINATPNLNMLAIQSRLKGDITGPDAFGAKTGGRIEAAFFGTTNSDVNGFRLRHAFLTLDWEHTSLLIGQFWHPMFVTSVFPGTVSFNTGAPFQPFSRNPQIRLTRHFGKTALMLAAMEQRDFASSGPQGTGSMYLRNAAVPNLHAQVQLQDDGMVLGVGADFKMLNPRLSTPYGTKNENRVTSLAGLAYARFKLNDLVWKVEGIYGQNMTDHLMLGGYGVESMNEETGLETYIPTNMFSAWTDISTGNRMAMGLFAGVTKNLGASEDLLSFWGRGSDIDMIYRVSPRVMWNSGSTRLAAELEYTAASYGTMASDGSVDDAEFVGNLRLLLAAYYFF